MLKETAEAMFLINEMLFLEFDWLKINEREYSCLKI